MSYLTQITSPASEPVSLAEAKLHCRVDDSFTADDTWFTIAIQAAREQCEAYQSRAWGQRSYRYVLDGFPRVIKLPVAPAVSITSINYEDSNGNSEPLTDFIFDSYSSPPRITPRIYHIFPVTSPRPSSVQIVFVAGNNTITAKSKMGILEFILHIYEHRGDEEVEIPSTVKALWNFDCWGANQC